jgi:hypothetical protein
MRADIQEIRGRAWEIRVFEDGNQTYGHAYKLFMVGHELPDRGVELSGLVGRVTSEAWMAIGKGLRAAGFTHVQWTRVKPGRTTGQQVYPIRVDLMQKRFEP